jgi:hypothetical protein
VGAFNPFEWLGGIRPRLQVSAAVGTVTVGHRVANARSVRKSRLQQTAVGRRKTEDGTILGKNGAFRLDYNTRHGEDTNEDEGTNYIPWRLMELLTHVCEVHMDSVVLATGPTLDKTLLSWSAFSAGFFSMSTTLPNQ